MRLLAWSVSDFIVSFIAKPQSSGTIILDEDHVLLFCIQQFYSVFGSKNKTMLHVETH